MVSWKVDSGPNSGRNCFGRFSREAGHNRVPAPPHMIKGTIARANSCSLCCSLAQKSSALDIGPNSTGGNSVEAAEQ